MTKRILTLFTLPLILVACGGGEEPKPAPSPVPNARGAQPGKTGLAPEAYQNALLARRLRVQAGISDAAQVTYEHVSDTPRERARRRFEEFHAQRRQRMAGSQPAR